MAIPAPTRDAWLRLLQERLPEKRLRHVLGVAGLAADITRRFALDEERLETAALLHDLCRALPKDELLARAAAYGLPVNEMQRAKPMLLHGPLAAEEARRELGVNDAAVYEAIYWHTTGTPGLGPIGRALIVADFAEPNRDYPEAAEARALLDTAGLDAALCYVAEQKCAHVQKKAAVADPSARAFLNWLKAR